MKIQYKLYRVGDGEKKLLQTRNELKELLLDLPSVALEEIKTAECWSYDVEIVADINGQEIILEVENFDIEEILGNFISAAEGNPNGQSW